MDTEKRKKALLVNFLKRNLHIQKTIGSYGQEYKVCKERNSKSR